MNTSSVCANTAMRGWMPLRTSSAIRPRMSDSSLCAMRVTNTTTLEEPPIPTLSSDAIICDDDDDDGMCDVTCVIIDTKKNKKKTKQNIFFIKIMHNIHTITQSIQSQWPKVVVAMTNADH